MPILELIGLLFMLKMLKQHNLNDLELNIFLKRLKRLYVIKLLMQKCIEYKQMIQNVGILLYWIY